MLRGELYDAFDPQLTLERRRARELTRRLNESRDEESELRARVIGELFCSVGKRFGIEPPFYCDYGTNIHIGRAVFCNFNCVILDPARVDIGNNVLLGPGVQIYTVTHPMDPASL